MGNDMNGAWNLGLHRGNTGCIGDVAIYLDLYTPAP